MARRTQTLEAGETATRTKARAPRQGRAFAALTWASILGQVRNVSTFFFGFLFPLAFISVFGLFSGPTSVKLGIVDGSDTSSPIYQALTTLSGQSNNADATLKLTLVSGTQDDLLSKLSHGNLDGVVSITPVTRTVTAPSAAAPGASPVTSPVASPVASPSPTRTPGTLPIQPAPTSVPGYDVTLTTSAASAQTGAAAQGILNAIISQINAPQLRQMPIQLHTGTVEGSHFSYIDFVLPGMLGFSLLSIAIFGTAFGFVVLKRTLVLKRIFATPTRPTTIVLAQGAARLIIAFLQVLVLLLAGIYLPFIGYHLADGLTTFAQMVVVSLFGLVTFLGMGLIIAGNFRDENAMGPVINLVTLPQFLLGGTFFPTDSFPAWIKPLADNMPLSYLNVALRDIASQGATLWDVRGPLLGLAVWGVVTYAIAIRTFKWE